MITDFLDKHFSSFFEPNNASLELVISTILLCSICIYNNKLSSLTWLPLKSLGLCEVLLFSSYLETYFQISHLYQNDVLLYLVHVRFSGLTARGTYSVHLNRCYNIFFLILIHGFIVSAKDWFIVFLYTFS